MNQPRLLNWIELSRAALTKNIASLAKLAGNRQIAVSVKANAYGHGLPEIVRMLNTEKRVGYITVHSIEEAAAARQNDWKGRIMLLGPVAPDSIEAVFDYDVEPTVFENSFLNRLGKMADKYKKAVRTHLKLETGTNRQGVNEDDLPALAELYKKYRSLKRPYGASTHFANIEDTTSHDYAQFQLDNFNRMVQTLRRLKAGPEILHTASSAAMILFEKTRFDLVRPGISVYGYWSSKETYLSYLQEGGSNDLFEPVLSWKSRITQIKQLATDTFVGYGCTYRTTAPTRLGVVPIGYYDGYGRQLSNQSYLLVNGRRAPVRGRICMNLLMIDITPIKSVKIDQPVTIIGVDGSESVTADSIADWSNSINYEVLARLSPATPRVAL